MNLDALFKERDDNADGNVTTVSESLIRYVEAQLQQEKPFAIEDAQSSVMAKERIEPLARQVDGRIPAKDRGTPFKTPYLWGKVMTRDSRERKLLLRAIRKLATTDYSTSSDVFSARFFHRLNEIEDFLGGPVEIRPQQRQWLEMPLDYYLVLVENHTPVIPYKHNIYAFDAKDHQNYMTIFLMIGEPNRGDLIHIQDM